MFTLTAGNVNNKKDRNRYIYIMLHFLKQSFAYLPFPYFQLTNILTTNHGCTPGVGLLFNALLFGCFTCCENMFEL